MSIAPPVETTTVPQLRWWREVVYVLVFYGLYSLVRNQFGSASVDPDLAKRNALRIIDIQRSIWLYHEATIQGWFVGWDWFIRFWNVYYGTFHFIVTLGALALLFRRQPERYPLWRNTLAFTTGLALIGFATFPLMPPRLLAECGQWGACLPHSSYPFVDTLATIGGLWSFDDSGMAAISNQYAAMPSLHFAWSSWCAFVLYPMVRHRWARILVVLYPWLTLFAVIVTANHYWLDAAGGALVLGVGYLLARPFTELMANIAARRAASA